MDPENSRLYRSADLDRAKGIERMTDKEVLDRLTRILRDLLGNDSIQLTPQTTRPEVPGWDSFNYVNFIVAVEIEFNIRFHLADVEAFATVGDIVKQIQLLKG
jgi:acyl carrier protein